MIMMKAPLGYTGKILWVDLGSGTIREERPLVEVYRSFLGGYGLGVYFIYRDLEPGLDPLSPGNILGFCPGLLTGTPAPFTGRHMVCAKSPLTGTWGDSNAGGYFGPAIKRAGYDAIFFKGAAESPVYLAIDNESKEINDASDLWGLNVEQVENRLKKSHGHGAQVEAIGKAGEKLSLISGIVTDRGRIAARSGLGAVMGSKNLKALCLKGRTRINMADKALTLNLAKGYNKKVHQRANSITASQVASMAPKISKLYRILKIPAEGDEYMYAFTLHNYGTAFATSIYAEIGDMPIKNFKGTGFKDWPQDVATRFTGLALKKYRKKSYGCYGCPLKCGAILEVPEAGLEETHCPEYETLASFGGMILNPDVVEVFTVNHLLNLEGMDTISAGNVIAFAMECVERGILAKEDFKCKAEPEGFLPRWGDSYHLLPLLQMMIDREGIGDLLADGVQVAARKLGSKAREFAMHANGQELPMHDGRFMKGLALTYLADPTPGRHTAACLDFSSLGPVNKFMNNLNFKNATDPVGKGECNAKFVKFRQAFNAVGLCEYALPQGTYPLLEFIEAIYGWKITISEFLDTGWRIQALRQLFNAREHAIKCETPGRTLGRPPLEQGPLKGDTVKIEQMIEGYFRAIGFDETGIPTPQTLEYLGLDAFIPDLRSCSGVDIRV
ncbi:aldehyde ferredoxin oxidoreductase [Candidatus Bathyarchaeota archaeon]|nr:aldehyde ferredoxin oxidoreductase [Candidatus Bathyarchaeota archaeon]